MSWVITDITLSTDPRGEYGQDIVVSATLDDGRQVELIRSFGALPEISIHHTITHYGISAAIDDAPAEMEKAS